MTTSTTTDTPLVNWSRLVDTMESSRLDAMLVGSPAAVTYLSDFWSLSQWSRPQTATVFAIAMRQPDRHVHVVAPLGNTDLVAAPGQVPPTGVTTFGNFFVTTDAAPDDLDAEARAFHELIQASRKATPVDGLVSSLSELGLGTARIGVEMGPVATTILDDVSRLLPGVDFVPANTELRHVRKIKTPGEIDRLRAAAQLTEEAIMAAYAQGGASERDLATTYLAHVGARAATPVNTALSSGPRSAMPNGQATARRLTPGDLVRFDGGCRVRHYVADIARCGVVGPPTSRQARYYEAVRSGLSAMVERAGPGVEANELFGIGVDTVRRHGIRDYRRQHCGHGIGIENYDAPSITPDSEDVLEPNMVICLETPYYELGWGGVQAEDTMVVTDDGVELFTRMPDELVLVDA